MQGLLESLRPIWDKYRIEIFLISSSLVIAITSGVIFVMNQTQTVKDKSIPEPIKKIAKPQNNILVDLSGAVERADVYEVTLGARLKDVLIQAGGLSAEADRLFFARNYNLARILKDQEKIYIPSVEDVEKGSLTENQLTLQNADSNIIGASEKVNINTASIDQLDTLPGIGKVTGQKIIQNRPYQSLEDLLNKKIVNKSVYEKIKGQISL